MAFIVAKILLENMKRFRLYITFSIIYIAASFLMVDIFVNQSYTAVPMLYLFMAWRPAYFQICKFQKQDLMSRLITATCTGSFWSFCRVEFEKISKGIVVCNRVFVSFPAIARDEKVTARVERRRYCESRERVSSSFLEVGEIIQVIFYIVYCHFFHYMQMKQACLTFS